MANETTSAQMINPDVFGDMLQASFLGRVVLGNPANGFALAADTLVGVPGETVHFPKWGALGDLADLTEGVPMTTEQLTTSDDTATIKEAGKAAEVTDKAMLVGLGDPLAEIRRQYGVLAARKVDGDLITEATSAGAYTHSPAAIISWNEIVTAISKFGDEWDPADYAGLVIHSKQHTDLLKDTNFISRDKLGDLATIPRGVVGRAGGVNVYMTDRVTVAGGPTYKALLVRTNALGLLYKRRPIVEQDRDILKRSTVVTTNMHYAVKRVNDQGVCILTTQ